MSRVGSSVMTNEQPKSTAGIERESGDEGRRVFFLYPSRLVEEEILNLLFVKGYESYAVNDHVRMIPLLRMFKGSVLIVNIDFKVAEVDWPNYVKSIVSDESTKSTLVGVISTQGNPNAFRSFRTDVVLPCGLIDATRGAGEWSEALLRTLVTVHARGRRQHVRLRLGGSAQSFNVNFAGTNYTGKLLDISRLGMAVVFDSKALFDAQTFFEDIQLRLLGSPIGISGEIVGKRVLDDGTTEYVILFGKNVTEETSRRVSAFLHASLQKQMDDLMSSLTAK